MYIYIIIAKIDNQSQYNCHCKDPKTLSYGLGLYEQVALNSLALIFKSFNYPLPKSLIK